MSTSKILSPLVEESVRGLHVDPDRLPWLSPNGVEHINKTVTRQQAQHKAGMAKSKKSQTVKTVSAIALLIMAVISQIVVWNWMSGGDAPWGEGSFGVGNSLFVFITSILFMFILLKKKPRKKWYVFVAFLYIGLYYSAPTDTAVIMFSQFIPAKLFMALPVPLFILGIKLLVSSNRSANKTTRLRVPRVLKNNHWSENEKKDQKVFGRAGSVGDAGRVFGEGRAAAGAEGEMNTAFLLDNLLAHIPGVTIYHGLRFPGSHDADIDHAVVIGNRIILVDTKMFRKGHYGLDRGVAGKPHQPIIFGGEGQRYENHMGAATKSIWRLIPSVSSVETVILMHNRQGQAKVIPKSSHLVDPMMLLKNAHDGINYIGSAVARDAGSPVNEEIKRAMLSLLK